MTSGASNVIRFGFLRKIFAPTAISKLSPPQFSKIAEQVHTLRMMKQTSPGRAPGVIPKNNASIASPRQLMMPIPIPPNRVPRRIAPITMTNWIATDIFSFHGSIEGFLSGRSPFSPRSFWLIVQLLKATVVRFYGSAVQSLRIIMLPFSFYR